MQSDPLDDRRTTTGSDDSSLPATGVAAPSHPAQYAHDVDAAHAAHEGDRMAYEPPTAALRESEGLFRTTFDRSVVGIAHVSPEGRWLRVNQRFCDILGYDREELATHTFQDITHPDDLATSLTCLRRLLTGELEGYELDKRSLRMDGTPAWAHLTVTLVHTPEGAPDYFIAMVQDITERKRLEQERARLFEWERTARTQAEATNAQLLAMQALTDTALSHLALDDLLRELLGRVLSVMGVGNVGIFLLDEDGRTLTLHAARGLGEEHVGRVQFRVGHGFVGGIAARRAPLIVDDLSAFLSAFTPGPSILRKTARSAVGVPLLVVAGGDGEDGVTVGHLASRLVGVLTVGSATPRRFTADDVQLLQRAADRVALAIDRARLYAAEQGARQCVEAALARAQASEAQAAERAERLNTILETMADGVGVYDAAGRPIQTNRAYRELFAVEHAPAGYETLTALERVRLFAMRDAATGVPLPLESIPVTPALRGEVVTGLSADVRVRAFDGRELEVNNSAAPLREPDGRVMGVVVLLHDMTERNRLARERAAARADELAAREANRRMEQFLATAAHDLRSPLTATIGYLDLVERQAERLAASAATAATAATAAQDAPPDLTCQVATMQTRLQEASQSAERLARLVTLLFDTAAMRTGRLELHRTSYDLAALVREQVAGQRAAAPGRVIRLHVPEGNQPVPVEADADRIGQVVANFLSNALKYAPPERPIDVSVLVRRGRAHVAVCDRGPGIAEGERSRVWEPFHRVSGVRAQSGAPDGATAGTGRSMGLGLHICKAIVEAHGGRVGVKSAVGRGSTFWFTLSLSTLLLDLPGTIP